MKARCTYKNWDYYHRYGGRGITFCDEWQDFAVFKEWAYANGYEPGLSLDRIDNDGDYFPSNCRWATKKEQGRNKRNNFFITAFGETKLLVEWIEDSRCVMSYNGIRHRLNSGWTPEEAITLAPYQRRQNR